MNHDWAADGRWVWERMQQFPGTHLIVAQDHKLAEFAFRIVMHEVPEEFPRVVNTENLVAAFGPTRLKALVGIEIYKGRPPMSMFAVYHQTTVHRTFMANMIGCSKLLHPTLTRIVPLTSQYSKEE